MESAQGESQIGAEEAMAALGEWDGSPCHQETLEFWGWSKEVKKWLLLRKRGCGGEKLGLGGAGEGWD